ncbi:MAG: DNA polymerase III subunit delta [Rhodospirillaceae bacterium]|nr:DNA polymerase III subunit delta [Rhodospirillaceae bacterium]
MKLAAAAAERFVAKPDPGVRAVLLHGPDAGLVRERMNALTRAVAGSTDDPFNVAEFAAAALRDDPARLMDESAALSLMGGRRVVRVRDADAEPRLETAVLAAFKAYFAHGVGQALVILTAGDIGSRAALVKLFEDTEPAAAIACYPDEGRTLEGLVREMFKAAGLSATPDAVAFLTDQLGGDREMSRRELEKLILYKQSEANRTVTESDVIACVCDTAALALDDLIFAAGDGDHLAVQRVYRRLMDEGVSPIAVLGGEARHMIRLHDVAGRMAEGKSAEQAMMGLRPPPFFKVKDRFRRQAERWSVGVLNRALELLTEAEVQAKSTDMPGAAIVERALLQLAQAARGTTRAR